MNAFLIKMTEFFRDPQLFDYLNGNVLPGLIEEAERRRTSSGSGPPGASPARRSKVYSSPEDGAGVQVRLPLRNGGG